MRQAMGYIDGAGGVEFGRRLPVHCSGTVNATLTRTELRPPAEVTVTSITQPNIGFSSGPWSAAIHAGDEFQSYSSGVFDDRTVMVMI